MGYERNDRRDERDYRGGYGDPRDRGFFERAGDEVRSWFGDEEAERRRRYDERYDERYDARGDRGYGYDAGRGYDSGRSAFGRYDARSPGLDPDNRYSSGNYRSEPRSNRDETYRRGEYSGSVRAYAAPYGQPEAGRQFDDDGAIGGGGYQVGGFGYDGESARRRAVYRDAYRQRDARGGYGANTPVGDHGDYHDWRDRQINAFDRDYDEYRRENRSRFESEFATWRQTRQTQRDALGSVKEHQEVVGSDGTHVGTVDHVRGDRILLTKTDRDAGGHHHTIPSAWISSVSDKITLSKTADEAKRTWTDAENRGGLFGRDDDDGRTEGGNLNRSFSGTY